MLQFFEDEEILFYADNIPKSLEHIMEQLNDTSTYKMPEDVKEGYNLGVKHTISILKQYLDQSTKEKHITFYNPDVKVSEEMDIKEMMQWAAGKFHYNKRQIMIVTKNGEELYGQTYEVDHSKVLKQIWEEFNKFKEELKIKDIAVKSWTIVEVE